jgi:hypothetical protein
VSKQQEREQHFQNVGAHDYEYSELPLDLKLSQELLLSRCSSSVSGIENGLEDL